MLVGAAVGIAAPAGWRTLPNSPYSGNIPSISEKTLVTRSRSITRPALPGAADSRAAPSALCDPGPPPPPLFPRSRPQQAETSASAAYIPARSSLIETPQRGGGSAVWPGFAVRWRRPPMASPIAPKAGLSRYGPSCP